MASGRQGQIGETTPGKGFACSRRGRDDSRPEKRSEDAVHPPPAPSPGPQATLRGICMSRRSAGCGCGRKNLNFAFFSCPGHKGVKTDKQVRLSGNARRTAGCTYVPTPSKVTASHAWETHRNKIRGNNGFPQKTFDTQRRCVIYSVVVDPVCVTGCDVMAGQKNLGTGGLYRI
jgi:hypothetical protein